MKSNTYSLKLSLVRPSHLASALRHAENLLCSMLCTAVAAIFWTIAIACFAAWCLYQTARGTLWLLRVLWRGLTWPIEIVIVVTTEGIWLVWVILVWIGGRIYRLVVATADTEAALGRTAARSTDALYLGHP